MKHGQIPPYGERFMRESVTGYNPDYGSRVYALKTDPFWFIRADKTSKRWWVFWGVGNRDMATRVSRPVGSMQAAMKLLTDGVDGGFYVTRD